MYQQNLPSRSQDIEAINFEFPRKKQQNIVFLNASIKKQRIEFVTS